MSEMTNMCECFAQYEKEKIQYDYSLRPLLSGNQTVMRPRVDVELKTRKVGDAHLPVLSYTCSWCGQEVGQRVVVGVS